MARGKKSCPKCKLEWGVRVLNCSCGHIFSVKKEVVEVKEDNVEEVNPETPIEENLHNVSMTDEKKQFKFTAYSGTDNVAGTIKKRKTYERPDIEIDRLMKDPEVMKIYPVPAGVPVEKLTAREQAHQVLGLGKKRATSLLRIAQMEKYWRTVDWKYVAQELGENSSSIEYQKEESEKNETDDESNRNE